MSQLTRDMVKKMPQPITSTDVTPAALGSDVGNSNVTSSDYSSGDYTSSSPSPLGNVPAKNTDDDALSSGSGGESDPDRQKKARPSSTTSGYDLPAHATLGSAKPTVSCYICGREFGSRSINIHEPQCLNKWRKENSELSPDMQRPEPKKPELVYDDTGKVDRAAMEEAAWQSHLDTLVKCPTCPRTFLPERLVKHQKACRGDSS
ncbi:hypothetical protein HAZT_HAZT001464 [Hyalella azteca]|uniref:C2HC/C3H-type domain-containing protein n=1 Tax=Hyalella azteca TaxID=294128 RepID=A0A6A0GT25_HYAAZ|nr:hypothetical protein HAZT_HAZT001464 [Hyalella azteca]